MVSQKPGLFRLAFIGCLAILEITMANAQPTVESQRDTLFEDGAALRTRVVEALEQAYRIRDHGRR